MIEGSDGLLGTVVFFRNLIVVSTAPTTWPNLMLSASSTFRVLTMNLEVVGIGCLGALRLLFSSFFSNNKLARGFISV